MFNLVIRAVGAEFQNGGGPVELAKVLRRVADRLEKTGDTQGRLTYDDGKLLASWDWAKAYVTSGWRL